MSKKIEDALRKALEGDGGVRYASEDSEVGERVCCGVMEYRPHTPDCWVTLGRAALKESPRLG